MNISNIEWDIVREFAQSLGILLLSVCVILQTRVVKELLKIVRDFLDIFERSSVEKN